MDSTHPRTTSTTRERQPGEAQRSIGWLLLLLALAGFILFTQPGCSDEFREAAGPALEQGVNSLLDGFVDGVFAVVDPDATTADGTTTTE
jgi:hypothetical protein